MGFVGYMPSPFYPASVVLFQLRGGMVSPLAIPTSPLLILNIFSAVIRTVFEDPYLPYIGGRYQWAGKNKNGVS